MPAGRFGSCRSLLTSQIRIRVGEYDFSSDHEPHPFTERAVTRKVVHPKYNFFTYEYDLAMVRFDNPVNYAPHIVPICLPGSDDLLIGENATVTGWGRLSEGGTLPSVLQEVMYIKKKKNSSLTEQKTLLAKQSIRENTALGWTSIYITKHNGYKWCSNYS